MKTSTDVTMPTSLKPIFPNECVVCCSETFDTAKITQNSQNPISVFFMPILWLFRWSRVEFPLCRNCLFRFYFQRWGRWILCCALIAIAFPIIAPYYREWSPLFRKIAIGVSCFVAMIPYVLFEVFVPRAFNTTSYPKTTTYEFASQDLALQFYALNTQRYPKAEITIS